MEYQNEKMTMEYYNGNATRFYQDTIRVEFSEIQKNFTQYLSQGARILDFGCGSGRDSKAFLDQGYQVDSLDGSEEMCKLAEKLTGQSISQMRFQDFEETSYYDGIWACASLLHLEPEELKEVLLHLYNALKMDGYLYASFKYGEFTGIRNGRYFTDMTQENLMEIVQSVGGFETVDIQISTDARPGRDDEKWINIILRKTTSR